MKVKVVITSDGHLLLCGEDGRPVQKVFGLSVSQPQTPQDTYAIVSATIGASIEVSAKTLREIVGNAV